MTLQQSGPISMSQIAGEFGGDRPIKLGDYVAGKRFVQLGSSNVNEIHGLGYKADRSRMSDLYGCSNSPTFMFTKTAEGSSPTMSVIGAGLPEGYDSNYHGLSIWPAGKGEGSSGWVGKTITSPTSKIKIIYSCDDDIGLYINKRVIANLGGWNQFHEITVNVVPGIPFAVSASVSDSGKVWRNFCCRIEDENGNVIALSGYDWVSDGAEQPWMFIPRVRAGANGNFQTGNYDSSRHGSIIWMPDQAEHGDGWLGTTFTSSDGTLNIEAICDDTVDVYVNKTGVLGVTWDNLGKTSMIVAPGELLYISAKVHDFGGLWGLAMRLEDGAGNFKVTDTSWWSS